MTSMVLVVAMPPSLGEASKGMKTNLIKRNLIRNKGIIGFFVSMVGVAGFERYKMGKAKDDLGDQ